MLRPPRNAGVRLSTSRRRLLRAPAARAASIGPEDGLRGRRAAEVDRPARGPNAPTACRSASRTLNACISGGSPTALDPYTTPDSVARSNRCTLNSSGISEKLGIL